MRSFLMLPLLIGASFLSVGARALLWVCKQVPGPHNDPRLN